MASLQHYLPVSLLLKYWVKLPHQMFSVYVLVKNTSNILLWFILLLSVQCYAWTEYKFTCVCVCVCVSVTLSVNSPTGQTPQQIFTVDNLKDGDLRKMCILGVSYVQSPPKPLFWRAWIGISSQICGKIQIAISSDPSIRSTWNLTGSFMGGLIWW